MSRGTALITLAIAAVVALVALDGCGDDDGAEDPTAEYTLLQVGVLPVANVAPLYLGIEKGFFGEEGLRIRPVVTTGGTAIVAPVVGGQLEMGVPDTVSVLQSAARGEPVEIIAQGGLAGDSPRRSWAKLLALPDGPVRSLADLRGHAVAVNRLGGISEVAVKAALAHAGVDPARVTFTIVPLDQMLPALNAGRVQAIAATEPLVTQGKEAGAVPLGDLYTAIAPDLTAAAFITSRQYVAEHPDVVRRFVRAVNRSLTYASAHPEEVRAIMPTYMTITPEVAKKIVLATWSPQVPAPALETLGRLSEQFGVLGSMPSLTRLVQTAP